MLGKHPISKDKATELVKLLKVPGTNNEIQELICCLNKIPENRSNTEVANDPVVARLTELVNVYGETLKVLIQEEAGDGIMSAIDCQVTMDKQVTSSETRIVIAINGKFLKYKHQ